MLFRQTARIACETALPSTAQLYSGCFHAIQVSFQCDFPTLLAAFDGKPIKIKGLGSSQSVALTFYVSCLFEFAEFATSGQSLMYAE